jgi:hypothetical protein
MLSKGAYGPLESGHVRQRELTHKDFVREYPQRKLISDIKIADSDLDLYMVQQPTVCPA